MNQTQEKLDQYAKVLDKFYNLGLNILTEYQKSNVFDFNQFKKLDELGEKISLGEDLSQMQFSIGNKPDLLKLQKSSERNALLIKQLKKICADYKAKLKGQLKKLNHRNQENKWYRSHVAANNYEASV